MHQEFGSSLNGWFWLSVSWGVLEGGCRTWFQVGPFTWLASWCGVFRKVPFLFQVGLPRGCSSVLIARQPACSRVSDPRESKAEARIVWWPRLRILSHTIISTLTLGTRGRLKSTYPWRHDFLWPHCNNYFVTDKLLSHRQHSLDCCAHTRMGRMLLYEIW